VKSIAQVLLLIVCVRNNKLISLIENEATFFRENSPCARLLSAFGRIHGYEYIRNLVKPLLGMLERNAPSFELNPISAQAQNQNVKENQAALQYTVEGFLDIILRSAEQMPPYVTIVISLS
jgi:hypothetical protein